jgi:carbon monoxide dehydrogenase subunit G
MTVLRETIETTLPVADSFAFVADFANSQHWDPGVATSERIDAGPLGVGATYRLGVYLRGKVAPMEYRITTWEPNRRVILAGEGSNVSATDEIRFEATPGGTRIDYVADIRLTGWMRLATPFAGGAFDKLAKAAVGGMKAALDERAAAVR